MTFKNWFIALGILSLPALGIGTDSSFCYDRLDQNPIIRFFESQFDQSLLRSVEECIQRNQREIDIRKIDSSYVLNSEDDDLYRESRNQTGRKIGTSSFNRLQVGGAISTEYSEIQSGNDGPPELPKVQGFENLTGNDSD